ncbi:dehydrogenase [Corynebacterium sp. CNJ-954]|nr:dehydrogenase [Corynebacterium sp. CNJ-954]
MASSSRPTRIAVIGAGVSGLTAAYELSSHAAVTVYEADGRAGGHADTTTVRTGAGEVNVDTGFIVHNDRTYPVLLRMFADLGIRTRPAEMSLSVRADDAHGGEGLEYAGARGVVGLFGDRRNLRRPAYLRMLGEILRFHRRARRLLAEDGTAADGTAADETLEEFLHRGRFSAYFVRHFMTPLVATVWSCDPATAGRYPARYLFTFLEHHGMLRVFGSPHWRTVVGGSHEYVRRIADVVTARGGEVVTGVPVTRVSEHEGGVSVTTVDGTSRIFDAVVVATHPDQALAMLAAPTPAQQEILSAMPYSRNQVQLHTDTSLLPRTPVARGAWNHLERGSGAVVVTYDMTRLMRLPEADGTRYLVTLNAADLVDPATVITTRDYSHPIYTPTSVTASRRSGELDSDRIVFAGAWQGWGFHEDGARSGLSAARRLVPLDESVRAVEPVNRVLRTTVKHARTTPVEHRFTHRSWMWLVDLDHLPDHGVASWWRGVFLGRDHLGGRSIRDGVVGLLRQRGITAPVGRIRMAAMPRAWGTGFNPLSVFWCDSPEGGPLVTVLEVHNTYGDSHAYVVRPDEAGRTHADKELYVSPFHGTDGDYAIRVPYPVDGRVQVGITLRVGDYSFAASVRGAPVHDGAPRWLDTARAAPAALVTAVLIRVHGIWLWARGLPVQPRPHTTRTEVPS